MAFTRWLTRRWQVEGRISTDREIRLPNEPEWEKAARGGEMVPEKFIIGLQLDSKNKPKLIKNLNPKRSYPWGGADNRVPNLANCAETGIGSTSPVGCFRAGVSPYGAMEMSGNVWEWTRSVYMEYRYMPYDGREKLTSEEERVLRGGSWIVEAEDLRFSIRDYILPGDRDADVGFRVVCVARTL